MKIMKIALSFLAIIIITTLSLTSNDAMVHNHPVHFYTVNDIDGNEVKLEQYKGKVILIVNVASKCGYTPQYEGLESMYKKFKDKGFEILAFPCNQFRGQEPGTNQEIKEFCSSKFGVTFQLFDKIDVNGENAHPLFKYLTAGGEQPIKWNFEKFLVEQNGVVLKRYGTKVEPKEIEKDIENILSGKTDQRK
jgi:glutathione peroxidase